MRWCLSMLCVLVALAAFAAAVPVPEARPETLQDSQAQLPAEVQERISALQLDEQQLEQVTRDKRTIAVLRQLFPGLGQTELNPEENQLAGAESEVNEVRAQYREGNGLNNDQEAAASGGNDVPDPANLAIENDEDADRDKRQFSFGGGSSGGSGNFLFDIIRLVTGGSSSGANSEAHGEASTDGTSGGDRDEGYGDGIPGPVTRLFIIANRGIANLIQDLILRIAQTSERLVNFKARLITSII